MILAFTYDSRTDINWSEAAREAEKAGVVSIREVGEERVGPAAAGQVHMRRRSRVCDPDGKELEERAAQDALRPFLQAAPLSWVARPRSFWDPGLPGLSMAKLEALAPVQIALPGGDMVRSGEKRKLVL